MFQLFVLIALMLDALIAGRPEVSVETTKPALYEVVDDLTPAFLDMGFEPITPTITFENMGGGYGRVKVPIWQVYFVCSKDLEIGMQFRYENFKYHDTPFLHAVVAHELAHNYQGARCMMPNLERDAVIMDLVALQNSEYTDALLWQLREFAVMRALEEKCDRTWMSKLSEQGQALYGKTSCSTARSYHRYTQALVDIIEDEDGKIDLPDMPTLDISKLQELLKP